MSEDLIGRGWVFPPRIDSRGCLALTHGQNEIEQAIQIILSTAPGQRVMHATFGCSLSELVFAPNNSQTAAQARRCVEEALGMWEPRINVTRVEIRSDLPDASCLLIHIDYEVKTTHDRRSLVYPFYLSPESRAGS